MINFSAVPMWNLKGPIKGGKKAPFHHWLTSCNRSCGSKKENFQKRHFGISIENTDFLLCKNYQFDILLISYLSTLEHLYWERKMVKTWWCSHDGKLTNAVWSLVVPSDADTDADAYADADADADADAVYWSMEVWSVFGCQKSHQTNDSSGTSLGGKRVSRYQPLYHQKSLWTVFHSLTLHWQ